MNGGGASVGAVFAFGEARPGFRGRSETAVPQSTARAARAGFRLRFNGREVHYAGTAALCHEPLRVT